MENIIAFTKINNKRDVLIREFSVNGCLTYCIQVREDLVPIEAKIFENDYDGAEKFYNGFATELIEEVD